ncbi:multiple sugar transport system substrate-binding protein [Friedmanniella endophytica]|uniref:Multiple sugar transport system substrate-binding protein n=1 Tax=Microlunatus kandeliicorticis TaxID=1759536 RepID=A0A7W3IVG5_9ACTN|nr:sugar ABC transporter substrate-binding protein [Microlunatus kandeliicorticis]MBA8795850.1 multiple sugar transport system substrate-binding protein [Microlunatus kandeliicorticis]
MSIPGPVPRRRFLALGGGLAAAAALTACGSNTGRPSSGGASGGSSGGGPTLTQWYHQYGEDGVEDAVKRYAAAYDKAKIEVVWNVGDYEKAVGAALLTQKKPDVFEYGNGPTLDMISANQVLDLTEQISSAKDDFPASVLAPMTWKDKVWAVPQTIDMQMLYYRKSMLSKAGQQPPQTFDELISVAKAVATKSVGGFFAGNDSGFGVLANLMIWSAGAEQINSSNDGPGFVTSAVAAGLEQYRALKESGGLLGSASGDWSAPDPFVNGECAMMWNGLWNMPIFTSELKDDFGVIPFPKIGSGGRQAVPIGAFASCVTAQGTNPDAAKEFVRWLWVDNTADQLDFSTKYGFHIPARKSLVAKATNLTQGPAKDAVSFVEPLGHGPSQLWTPATSDAFLAAFSNVVLKGADAQKQLASAGETCTKEIKRLTS